LIVRKIKSLIFSKRINYEFVVFVGFVITITILLLFESCGIITIIIV